MTEPKFDRMKHKKVINRHLKPDGEVEEIEKIVPLNEAEKRILNEDLMREEMLELEEKVAKRTDVDGELQRLIWLKQYLGR